MKLLSFKVTSNQLSGIALDKKYKHLVPDFVSEHVEMILGDCSSSFKQSLIRTLECEVLVNHLDCVIDNNNIITTDGSIQQEIIQSRLRTVPLMQNVPLGTTFSLNYTNKSADVEIITMGDLTTSYKGIAFNKNIPLVCIEPSCTLKIGEITIDRHYPYESRYGMVDLCVNFASQSLDVKPYNQYASSASDIGVKAEVANPRKWLITFNTNGTMPAKECVKYACETLADRFKEVLSVSIANAGNRYSFTMQGENHTISNLLQQTICEMHPVGGVIVNTASSGRQFTMHISNKEDIDSMLTEVVNYTVGTYKTLAKDVMKF